MNKNGIFEMARNPNHRERRNPRQLCKFYLKMSTFTEYKRCKVWIQSEDSIKFSSYFGIDRDIYGLLQG